MWLQICFLVNSIRFNFVNPSTVKNINTSKVDEELDNIYNKTGESTILPATIDKKYTINGHFETSGNVAHSNIIPIKKSVRQITVYIEDNAKNWTVQTVNVNI